MCVHIDAYTFSQYLIYLCIDFLAHSKCTRPQLEKLLEHVEGIVADRQVPLSADGLEVSLLLQNDTGITSVRIGFWAWGLLYSNHTKEPSTVVLLCSAPNLNVLLWATCGQLKEHLGMCNLPHRTRLNRVMVLEIEN